MGKNSKLRYHTWLINLAVGDEVIVTGSFLLISPLSRSVPLVCLLKNRSLGAIHLVEKINEKSIRVAGRYFSLQDGVSAPGSTRYRLCIYPLFDEPLELRQVPAKELQKNCKTRASRWACFAVQQVAWVTSPARLTALLAISKRSLR